MAKSRKEWLGLQWLRRALEVPRIWPVWTRSLGAMIEAEAIVRFGGPPWRRVYDRERKWPRW